MNMFASLILICSAFLFTFPIGWAHVHGANPFHAEYFNNLAFEGTPALSRDEPTLDFNWGFGAPDSSVDTDYFTARYTSDQDFSAGDYTFEVTADDGVRVYVDDELIIDQWVRQSPTTHQITKTLTAGVHSIRIDYFEFNIAAMLAFDWYPAESTPQTPTPTATPTQTPTPLPTDTPTATPTTQPTPTGTGNDTFLAQYFANGTLSGTPVRTENIDVIDFAWEYGSPHASVPVDHFSARFTRDEVLSEGYYRFSAHADDGIRILVDGNPILDGWKNQGVTEYVNYTYLTAGNHTITVEYYEYVFGATVNVQWQPVAPFVPSATHQEIMPLGDSITHGWTVPGGYRNKLFTLASQLNFVGSDTDGPTSLPDKDHDGHPGWRIDEIMANASGWVSYYKPDRILLMIGTNDIVQNRDVSTMSTRLSNLISLIHTAHPNAQILVSSIPPLADGYKNQQAATYNSQIPGVIQAKKQAGIPVTFVDITASMNLSDIEPDGIHPTAQGYDKIAQGWATGLGQLGTGVHTNPPTPTPTETTPSTPADTYLAEYFNNINLVGTPALVRNEADINYVWGYGSPDASIQNDFFSARWTKSIETSEGPYTFEVSADDGVRLILDGNTIIDQWKDQGTTTYRATIDLEAGTHTLVMEYYERWVGAEAKLTWGPASTATQDTLTDLTFDAEYYDNINLQGFPRVMSTVDAVDFNFGYGSPHDLIPSDFFSARWTAKPFLSAGTYRFTTTSDDGVRLIIDGNTIIDDWNDHGNLTHERELVLGEGEHTIVMEYYEHWVGAYAKLSIIEL